MSSDPVESGTGPVSGEAPAEAGRHRSVADGDLTASWTLKDYFASLNSVMRLPGRPRRKAKDAAGEAATARPGGVARKVIMGAGLAAVAVLAMRLFPPAASSGQLELTPVVGVWEAGKGKYRGHHFEVTDSTVVFQTGERDGDVTAHPVQRVQVQQVADSTLFTIRYGEGDAAADLAFWLRGKVIRLKNQPETEWSRRPSGVRQPLQRL
jgi:hypothetical protein